MSLSRRFRSLAFGTLLLGVTFALPAGAQDDASRSAARRLATAGVEALQRDDYATAVEKLQRAYQMLPAPSVCLWLARALVKQGHLVAASERYLEVGRLAVGGGDVAVQEGAKKEAAAEVEALLPKIPSVLVTLEGASASEVTLSLDGVPLTSAFVGEDRPVDPGKHHIEGRRGEQVVVVDVSVVQAEKRAVVLRFDAPAGTGSALPSPGASPAATGAQTDVSPRSTGSTRKIVAWSAIGAGAAGLVVGGVTGALALGKKGELDDSPDCSGHSCLRSSMQDKLDNYGMLRTVSSIGFIAGGVLAATGVVLLVTDSTPSQPGANKNALRLRVGASCVTAEGTF